MNEPTKEQANEKNAKFAAILRQIAQEFDIDVMYPDDPNKIYLMFNERNPRTRELQGRINRRMKELEAQP